MINIRRVENSDHDEIWSIIHEAFLPGDTYAFSPETSKKEGLIIWVETPLATYVAVENHRVIGTYFIKPNQPGLGSHVCNAGFIVSSHARGKGVGRAMCEHSLLEAKALGFKAMQFNCVVATNQAAVKLWQKCGFHIVGRLHKAFQHQEKGLVDAYIMYQWLAD